MSFHIGQKVFEQIVFCSVDNRSCVCKIKMNSEGEIISRNKDCPLGFGLFNEIGKMQKRCFLLCKILSIKDLFL